MEIKGSSSIQGVDVNGDTVSITFKSGKKYAYEGVPQDTILEMLGSDSVGSFFSREIRPNFKGELVEDAADG